MSCTLFHVFLFEAQAQSRDTINLAVSDSLEFHVVREIAIATEIDSVLAARLEQVYQALGDFEKVHVEVHERVVRLTGTVVDASKRRQAVELAGAFPGVVYVIDDLGTEIELEARITPAVDRIQSYISDAISYMPILGIALVVLIFFGLLARFADGLLPSFRTWGLSHLAGQLLVRLLRAFLWIIGLILALDILGITALVGAVLGTAGLMGIAIGFAFKDIIENYLAGLLLSVRHPFNLNDYIKIGDEEGKVVRLTSRELVLMTLDGNHVRIPNSIVFKNTIYNFTRNPRRRFSFEAGIDVEEDLQRVQRIGIDTLINMESIMDSPKPFSVVRELGDFNVILTYYGWVDQTRVDFLKARSEAIRMVKNALDEAGVLMPEPIYNVRMRAIPHELFEESSEGPKVSKRTSRQMIEGDVAPEKDIEEQIEEDLRTSGEPNLLTNGEN